MICSAFASFSVLDTLAKYASGYVHTLEVVWFRYAGHILFACIYFRIWSQWRIMRTERPWMQILRGIFLLGATFLNFLALRYLQLAETTAIMFAAPFVMTALAGPLLNEWAGPRRWAAIVVGFIGVLIVTQPGSGPLNWAVLYSVGAMLCYAFYSLMTRLMASGESHASMLLWSAAIALVILTPAVPSVWTTPPTLSVWMALLATGLVGGFGHWLFIRAHDMADVPTLAPYNYTAMVWMVLLGYAVFGDVPGPSTIVGATVIICSGLYLLYRERKVGAG